MLMVIQCEGQDLGSPHTETTILIFDAEEIVLHKQVGTQFPIIRAISNSLSKSSCLKN